MIIQVGNFHLHAHYVSGQKQSAHYWRVELRLYEVCVVKTSGRYLQETARRACRLFTQHYLAAFSRAVPEIASEMICTQQTHLARKILGDAFGPQTRFMPPTVWPHVPQAVAGTVPLDKESPLD